MLHNMVILFFLKKHNFTLKVKVISNIWKPFFLPKKSSSLNRHNFLNIWSYEFIFTQNLLPEGLLCRDPQNYSVSPLVTSVRPCVRSFVRSCVRSSVRTIFGTPFWTLSIKGSNLGSKKGSKRDTSPKRTQKYQAFWTSPIKGSKRVFKTRSKNDSSIFGTPFLNTLHKRKQFGVQKGVQVWRVTKKNPKYHAFWTSPIKGSKRVFKNGPKRSPSGHSSPRV